jgi:hypothetical protein
VTKDGLLCDPDMMIPDFPPPSVSVVITTGLRQTGYVVRIAAKGFQELSA